MPLTGYRGARFIKAQLQASGDYTDDVALNVFIEDTIDGNVWNVIGQFPTLHSAGIEVITITEPFTDTLRVRWEIEGTPFFYFSVSWYVEGA